MGIAEQLAKYGLDPNKVKKDIEQATSGVSGEFVNTSAKTGEPFEVVGKVLDVRSSIDQKFQNEKRGVTLEVEGKEKPQIYSASHVAFVKQVDNEGLAVGDIVYLSFDPKVEKKDGTGTYAGWVVKVLESAKNEDGTERPKF